jgi:hypothetical protein
MRFFRKVGAVLSRLEVLVLGLRLWARGVAARLD